MKYIQDSMCVKLLVRTWPEVIPSQAIHWKEYGYMKFRYKPKTVRRPSKVYDGDPYTNKTVPTY